ncbi:MAG: 6-pyruvoyl trahydropterin synthase family protein [Parvibaculales bacterium]
MQLTREFHFDAAHSLQSYEQGHPNTRIHGHSFRVRVTLQGQPSDETGQILDLAVFGQALEAVRLHLDHHMLNDIKGLENPTLENICLWLWDQLQTDLEDLYAVEVSRDSLGQSCLYKGSHHGK